MAKTLRDGMMAAAQQYGFRTLDAAITTDSETCMAGWTVSALTLQKNWQNEATISIAINDGITAQHRPSSNPSVETSVCP
jgi:hypothetical protein